jgi:hypothetical protein
MMTKLFSRKKSNGSTLEALACELVELNSRRATFVERQAIAQQEVETARVRCDEYLLAGRNLLDDADGKLIAQTMHAAEVQVSHYTNIIATLDQQRADAEQRLIAERNKIERAAASKELRAKADAGDAALEKFRSSNADVISALNVIVNSGVPYSNIDFPRQVREVLSGIESAIEERLAATRAHAAEIEQGGVPIVRPEVPVEVVPAPVIPMQSIYTLVDSKWQTTDGIKTCAKYRVIEVPVDVASAAIKYGWAVDPESDHAFRFRQVYTSPDYAQYHPSVCQMLTEPASAAEPQHYDGHPQTSPSAIEAEKIGATVSGVASIS